MLNPQRGNMYGFVTHTWNPIKGKCPYACSYCYARRTHGKELRLDEKCFKDNLDKAKFLFVGSSTDMWADEVHEEWLTRIQRYTERFPIKCLWQTKNPKRWIGRYIHGDDILCVTLETNRSTASISNAPEPYKRALAFQNVDHVKKMVTIEPVMDFDFTDFGYMLKSLFPDQINIGADSKGTKNLPEPSKEKLVDFIEELKSWTHVYVKPNLRRLLK